MRWRTIAGVLALTLCASAPGYAKEGNDRSSGNSMSRISLRTETDSVVRLMSIADAKATVFIFLSPECPISQQCTRELQLLFNRFAAGNIAFYGVSPGSFYTKEEIRLFRSTYKMGFPILSDDQYIVARQLGATITPEVFVVDSLGSTVYSGAIDNTYRALGKKNASATEHYLEAALTAITTGNKISLKRTTPVGCLVEGLKK